MKNISNKNIESLLKKILNETLEEKANELEAKLHEGEQVCEQCGSSSLMEGECSECGYKMSEGVDFLDEEENVCEQCGGEMSEGVCEQCSSMNESDEFDYVAEEEEEFGSDPEDRTSRFCDTNSEDYNEATCNYHKKNFMGGEMSEKLYGNQDRLDHNKNGRIDSDDLRMARAKKGKKVGGETDEEMEEGNAFTGALARAKKEGDKTFEVGGKKFYVKESKKSIQMTESQMIEFIEKIVLQEEEKLKSMGKTKGLNVYQKAHTASGKENKEYIQSLVKKMKDYMKDGSKGDFDMNPKVFPKGNGEMAEMKKKSYIPSDSIKDYVDNLTAAGLENLDYDTFHPNEKWVDDNVEGSSKTGNNPEWANTGESDVNKKRNKIRKNNMLAKVKRKAYNKSAQPIVTDETGDTGTGKLFMKLESVDDKQTKKINEEFDRMKNLMGYNQKTQ